MRVVLILKKVVYTKGHNLIAIVGIGSAIAMKAAIQKYGLKIHLKLFGTPAEERDGGKISMINSGAFKGLINFF